MKGFGKILLVLLVIAMLLPFTILKGNDGQALLSFSDLKMPNFSMPKVADVNLGKSSRKSTDTFYKWKDAQGNLQFTSEPPPEGIKFTTKVFDPNANVIQSVEVITGIELDNSSSGSSSNQFGTKSQQNQQQQSASPYSPESIKKLFEDAENIEKLLQDRMNKQNSALSQ